MVANLAARRRLAGVSSRLLLEYLEPRCLLSSNIAFTPDGALWTTRMQGQVYRTSGTQVEVFSYASNNGIGGTIAAAPDNTVWFADHSTEDGTVIRHLAADGSVLRTVALGDGVYATDIAVTGDGTLWAGLKDTGWPISPTISRLVRITPTSMEVVRQGLVESLTVDAAGNLWFADSGAGVIGSYSPAGEARPTIATSGVAWHSQLTAGPDGSIWISGDDRITRYAPDGSFHVTILPPAWANNNWGTYMTVTADGALWYNRAYIGFGLGRIAPDGTVLENSGTYLGYGLVTGPDGRIYATEFFGDVVALDPLQPSLFVQAIANCKAVRNAASPTLIAHIDAPAGATAQDLHVALMGNLVAVDGMGPLMDVALTGQTQIVANAAGGFDVFLDYTFPEFIVSGAVRLTVTYGPADAPLASVPTITYGIQVVEAPPVVPPAPTEPTPVDPAPSDPTPSQGDWSADARTAVPLTTDLFALADEARTVYGLDESDPTSLAVRSRTVRRPATLTLAPVKVGFSPLSTATVLS